MSKAVQFQVGTFSGPLDLLLALLDERKLTITDIALGEITEQYLAYLDTLPEREPDALADFLVIATKLLLLKAKALLPFLTPEVESDESSLEAQLRLYKAYADASRDVNRLWVRGSVGYGRTEPPRPRTSFTPPENLSLDALHAQMVQLLNRLKPIPPIPVAMIDRAVSLKETIDRIRILVGKRKQVGFQELLQSATSRTEVIVSFLALLELVKQDIITLRQETLFGDITIART